DNPVWHVDDAVRLDDVCDQVARAYRDGALVDDDQWVAHVSSDARGGVAQVVEISATVEVRRRIHRDKGKPGGGERLDVIGREAKASGVAGAHDDLFEAWLVNWHDPALQAGHPLLVQIQAHDRIAQIRETGSGCQSNVPGSADDADIRHRSTL